MTLTKQQRDRLKRELLPVVQDAVRDTVRDEIRKTTGALDDTGRDYLNKISEGQKPPARSVTTSRRGGDFTTMSNIMLAMAHGGGNRLSALAYARDHGMDDTVVKTLTAGDVEGGGAFIPSQMAEGFLDLLRPRSVVRNAGPNLVEPEGGSFEFPKLTQGAQAEWVGETGPSPIKQQKTGLINLTPKFLTVTTPLSIFMQRASSRTNIDEFVRNDLVRGASTAEDVAFIQGVGSSATPKGLTNWAAAANKFNANASVTVANTTADLRTARGNLANSDVPAGRRWWFMREEVLLFLQEQRDNGQLVFPETLNATPTLRNSPIGITNNIPADLGAGNDETFVVYAAMDDVWVGDFLGVIIRVSESGQFTDPTDGQTKDAFQSLTRLMQVLLVTDLVVGHSEAVSVIEQVTWHNA